MIKVKFEHKYKEKTLRNKLTAISPFIATIIFLLLGFCKNLWHPGWLVFLLIPAVPLFFDLISFRKGKLVAILNFLIIVAYLVMGFVFDLWHPGWVIFFLFPVVKILFGEKNYDEFE